MRFRKEIKQQDDAPTLGLSRAEIGALVAMVAQIDPRSVKGETCSLEPAGKPVVWFDLLIERIRNTVFGGFAPQQGQAFDYQIELED